MQRWLLFGSLPCLLAALLVIALSDDSPPELQDQGDHSALASDAEGLAAFDTVYDVLMHPRCMNCHPKTNTPLQGDLSAPHLMNVQRGPSNRGNPGMECSTCHHLQPVEGMGIPPGVASGNWQLAPLDMAFEGKSKRDMALMLKDEKRSHMDGMALIHHVEHDALVGWGWEPGEGRTPVPTPRAEFVKAFKAWVHAGMPVPEAENE